MNITISDTLYHFTRKLETLKQIIESSEFLLRLNPVTWTSPLDLVTYYYQIPMVCFCETPLPFLTGHVRTFGNYGLGMKIEWAIKHGIHNVIYVDNMNSSLHGTMINQLLQHFSGIPHHHRYSRTINDHLVGSTELMIHRSEREWRFIGEVKNTASYTFTPRSIPFSMDDVEEIVCLEEDGEDLMKYLEACNLEEHLFKIKFLPNA